MSRCTDHTVVERRQKPAESMILADGGLLTPEEIEELRNIGLGTKDQATQFWSHWPQQVTGPQVSAAEAQHDLLDFLRQHKPAQQECEVKHNGVIALLHLLHNNHQHGSKQIRCTTAGNQTHEFRH